MVSLWAYAGCRACNGTGLNIRSTLCPCVARHVFERAQRLHRYEGARSTPTLRGIIYRCDFEIAARRVLTAVQWRLFAERYLLRLPGPRRQDDNAACQLFYSRLRTVEQRVGRELIECGIYPWVLPMSEVDVLQQQAHRGIFPGERRGLRPALTDPQAA